MKFNNIEVNEKTFRRKMRGLDPEQVFDFLRRLSQEMESLQRDRNEARRRVKQVEVQLQEYKDRDELLKNTIANATKMSDRIRSDSDRESKLIIADAKQKAEVIVRDAKDSLKQIYQDVSDLKRVRIQFENNLRALMQSHIAMLEQGKSMMPDPEIEPESMRVQNKEDQKMQSQGSISQKAKEVLKDKMDEEDNDLQDSSFPPQYNL